MNKSRKGILYGIIICLTCLLLTGCVTAAVLDALSEQNEQDTRTRMIGEETQDEPGGETVLEATEAPTEKPTKEATPKPTEEPTSAPTPQATKAPTAEPTKAATKAPTAKPTTKATKAPTAKPTPDAEKENSYVLNTNTKKFHRPGCSEVKRIKSEHRKNYKGTRKSVISMGYQPCKKCNP